MRGRERLILMIVMTGAVAALPILEAGAACHAFTFSESTYTVSEEADKVTLTVARDGTLDDSSVKYNTVNGTAKSRHDFLRTTGTLSYAGDDEQQSFDVQIVDNNANEPTEEFTVVLSGGGGCDINPNFQYDSATVRIQDNDNVITLPTQSSSPTPTPTPTTTKKPKPKPSTASPSPSPSPTATSPSPTASASPIAAATDEHGGGLSSGAIAGIVAATLVAGGGAALWVRRRFLA